MEDGSSSSSSVPPTKSQPFDSNNLMSNISDSKFLANLPSLGFFSSAISSSNLGGMRVYICNHNTGPPENQVIKTNQMNILIRSLTLKKQNDGSSRKRASDRAGDGRASTKRTMTNPPNSSTQGGSSNRAADREFQGLTVERLRALLKEKGLLPKGKKDKLIARLRSASK